MRNLDSLMRNAKATNEELARVTGYATTTIADIRRGVRVPRKQTQNDILVALESFTFSYKKRGPKSRN